MFHKQAHVIVAEGNKSSNAHRKEVEFARKRKLYMLLGGRSGRISLYKDPNTGESIQVIDDDSSKPALELIFEYLRDPRSSLPANLWSFMLCVASSVRIIQLSILT